MTQLLIIATRSGNPVDKDADVDFDFLVLNDDLKMWRNLNKDGFLERIYGRLNKYYEKAKL